MSLYNEISQGIRELQDENATLREQVRVLREAAETAAHTIESLEAELKQYRPGSYSGSFALRAALKATEETR